MKHLKLPFSLSALALLLVAAFILLRVANNHRYTDPDRVIASDIVSYYAYLPAAFVEHDLSLAFTDHPHEGTYWPETLPDGRHVIKTSMGLSMMYMPFFLAAHALAPAFGYPDNGFSQPYALALMLAGVVYCILGLVLLRLVLRRHFPDWVTAVTLVVVALCTNLYWYTAYEAPMSHAFSFCLFALFIWLTERWHERPTAWRMVALGLVLGLISLVRPTNALVVVFFLLYGVDSRKAVGDKWHLLLGHWPQILLAAACGVLVWLPQMAYWHYNTGHLLHYSYGDRERFFFGDPKIVQGLFSFRKGWLLYTPVMAFALLGLVPLYRSHRSLFWGVAAFLPLNLYVVFSWWCWWYGGGLGQRALIESYALLALPLAAWLQWCGRQRPALRSALLVVTAAVAMLSAFHNVQYVNGSIHWDSMTRAAYCDSFLHRRPSERFASLLEEPDYEAARQGRR